MSEWAVASIVGVSGVFNALARDGATLARSSYMLRDLRPWPEHGAPREGRNRFDRFDTVRFRRRQRGLRRPDHPEGRTFAARFLRLSIRGVRV